MRQLSKTGLALTAVIILGLLLSGCTGLSFIKKRLPPPQITEKGVLFQFYSPSAQIVQVCGNWDTNNWCSGLADTGGFRIGAMEDPDGDGLWELFVKLPAGRYQYKFIIDEQNWKTDPNNPQRTDDGYGGSNSVLIVD